MKLLLIGLQLLDLAAAKLAETKGISKRFALSWLLGLSFVGALCAGGIGYSTLVRPGSDQVEIVFVCFLIILGGVVGCALAFAALRYGQLWSPPQSGDTIHGLHSSDGRKATAAGSLLAILSIAVLIGVGLPLHQTAGPYIEAFTSHRKLRALLFVTVMFGPSLVLFAIGSQILKAVGFSVWRR